MAPPRFSASSADRLQAVVEAVNTAVDSGSSPNAAMAKAAYDNALPVGHLALAVRAFNTGRAVGQLEIGHDAWEKAAAYPQASVEGVLAELNTLGNTKVAPAPLDEYYAPPGGYEPLAVKVAFAAPLAPSPRPTLPTAPAAFNEYASLARAGAAFDVATHLAERYPAGSYTAAKAAAQALYPDAATYLFSRLEAELPWVREKVATSPDPTLRVDSDPLVAAVAELAAAKAAAVIFDPDPDAPDGYAKVAEAPGWFAAKPRCPHLNLVIPEKVAVAPSVPVAAEPELVSFDPSKVAGFADMRSGFGSALSIPGALVKSPMTAGALDWRTTPDAVAAQKSKIDTDTAGDLRQIDSQAALQDVLADSRFAHADPKLVVETYRQLSGLAPRAIQNPAVAGDFIQRRLQTGNLSYFDVKALTEIEANIAKATKVNQHDGDD